MHRHNQPDLLPPPDGFDNTIPRHSSSSSSAYHQHNSGSHHTMQSSAYPIDTNTAKAIIDTYSGHLFSRSTNYHSFRGASQQNKQSNSSQGGGLDSHRQSKSKYPSSAVETLFTRDPTNFEQDSLDNSASNYYDQRHCTVVVQGPTPPNSSNKPNNTNTAPRVKTRTESVV